MPSATFLHTLGIPDQSNLILYESFIFPFICQHQSVWGQTVQWAPYIGPPLHIINNRCVHPKFKDCQIIFVASPEPSHTNVHLFSFLGRCLVESCEQAHSAHDDTAAQFQRCFADNSGLSITEYAKIAKIIKSKLQGEVKEARLNQFKQNISEFCIHLFIILRNVSDSFENQIFLGMDV